MNRNRAAFRRIDFAGVVGIFGTLKPFLKAEASAFLIRCSLIFFPYSCRIVSRDVIGMMSLVVGLHFHFSIITCLNRNDFYFLRVFSTSSQVGIYSL